MNALSLPCLEAPNVLICGAGRSEVGATVYRAIAALLAADGRLPIPELCRAVWGVPVAAKRAIWSLNYRVSEKLAAAGSPLRAALDDDCVILV